MGSGGRALERRAVNRRAAVQSHVSPFRNLGNFVHPTFACLSEETLKAGGPFYLMLMLVEVKDPTQGLNV